MNSRSMGAGPPLPHPHTAPSLSAASSAQDFFGVIEELRVWRVVRSAQQIRDGMEADNGRGPGEGREGGGEGGDDGR